MQIVETYPPNYADIQRYLNPPKDAVFAYGSTLYNPSKQEIPQDVIVHEEVHARQMQGWLPDSWWMKYLLDVSFRKEVEAEAYSVQYRWAKDRVDSRTAKLCLEFLVSNMVQLYNLDITQSQAETLIRKYAKR